jgi:hypothetical protein
MLDEEILIKIDRVLPIACEQQRGANFLTKYSTFGKHSCNSLIIVLMETTTTTKISSNINKKLVLLGSTMSI